MNDEAKRRMVATLLSAGRSVKDIIKDAGLSRTTVFKVQKLVKEGKDMKDLPIPLVFWNKNIWPPQSPDLNPLN
uniref:Resolvase HTH domain-containing protein n=1 Tax=Lepeophtheirus salmonis TaxID=72036 RepID=A0A0K2V1X0_LEPSM